MTTCVCGASVESYPAAITAHASTAQHVAWLDAKYAIEQKEEAITYEQAAIEAWRIDHENEHGTERNPGHKDCPFCTTEREVHMNAIDQLPNGDEISEVGTPYPRPANDDVDMPGPDPRTDPRLNDVAFVATDEGQALLAAAQEATRQDRLASKRASEKARRERIKQAERAPGVAQAEEDARRASAAAVAKIQADSIAASKQGNAPAKPVLATLQGNKALKLGTEPIEVDGERVYPILHRDGSIALHQTDNYIWKCPTCSRRLRAATCEGVARPHSSVPAPTGYRFADRKVAT